MKFVVFSLMMIACLSCKDPVKKKTYRVILFQNHYKGKANKVSHEIKIDTFSCISDTIAYNKAFIRYYVCVTGEQAVPEYPIKTQKFIVIDANGRDVKLKLSKKVTDSLEIRIKAISEALNKK